MYPSGRMRIRASWPYACAQVLAVQRVLARTTWQKLVAGQTADDVYPEAVADADRAFTLLQTGTRDAAGAGS
jgi:hypothetical protein